MASENLKEILTCVGKLLDGQARLESSLAQLTIEQRQHGERLQVLEQRGDQRPNKAPGRRSMLSGMSEASQQEPVATPRDSIAISEAHSEAATTPRFQKQVSSYVPWEDLNGDATEPLMGQGGSPQHCSLPEDWPACIKRREFGMLPSSRDSALASLSGCLNDRMTLKNASMVAQEAKEQMTCIIEPTSRKRICFDLVAMVFLLYDLCLTPVAIAWDFPMQGWLLYCTSAVATFWTMDIFMTSRTAYFHAGNLERRPIMIMRRYLRTTLLPDLLIVCVDWLTVFANAIFADEEDENPELIGAKLVRFSKATRAIRIVSVTRVVRIQEYLEHLGDRLHGGSSLKYVGDMARLIVIILWINHIMSCTWFYIGRMTEGDTGTSWLNDPIRDENSPLYSDTLPLFQYTTAFHWAITQMTPGSMQVFPRNSLERIFNIFALVFGMIFFSSLISSLSATMVNFRMKSTQTANEMAELRRFLRQSGISNKLCVSVQKQAHDRLMEVKPLTVSDVKALAVLSADVRAELQFELCQPYLMRNGFHRVCSHVEMAVLKMIMQKCIQFTFHKAGDTIFEAGQDAKNAYVIERGNLEYLQNRKTAKVKRRVRVGCHNEIIISEAALWTYWEHVGTLSTPNPASLLKLDVEKHAKIVAESELMGEFAAEMALHFRTRLAASKPPQAPWPSDMEVPQTSFDEIVVCASRVLRRVVSKIGMEVLRDQVPMPWARAVFRNMPKNLDELEKEIDSDKCMLMPTNLGDVERLAAVSTISIARLDGTVFMQLGTWDASNGLRVSCKLPGTKQELGETAFEAIQRCLRTELLPFDDLIDPSELPAQHEVEWSRSEKYNLRTKYLRTIFQLQIDDDAKLPRLQRLYAENVSPTKKRRSRARTGSDTSGRPHSKQNSRNSMFADGEAEACLADTHEVVGLPDSMTQRMQIFGWLHEEEVERFRGEGEGKTALERLMSRIHLDEVVLSCAKDLSTAATVLPVCDGSEIVLLERDPAESEDSNFGILPLTC